MFPEETDLRFRNQNTVAADNVSKTWRSRAKKLKPPSEDDDPRRGSEQGPCRAQVISDEAKQQRASSDPTPRLNSFRFVQYEIGEAEARHAPDEYAANKVSRIERVESVMQFLTPNLGSHRPSLVSALSNDDEIMRNIVIKRLFFDVVVSPPPVKNDNGRGSAEFLPTIYAKATAAGNASVAALCVQETVLAFAYANFAGRVKASDAKVRASKHYGEALRHLTSALHDVHLAVKDETLLSVQTLGVLEISTQVRPITGGKFYSNNWHKHKTGALLLLRHRGQQQLQHEVGTRLFVATLNETLTACINHRRRPLVQFEDWLSDVKPNRQSLYLCYLMHRTATVCADFEDLRYDSLSFTTTVILPDEFAARKARIIECIQHLDTDFEAFHEVLRTSHPFEECPFDPGTAPSWCREYFKDPGCPRKVHVYRYWTEIQNFNQCRGARTRLLQTFLDALILQPPRWPSIGADTEDMSTWCEEIGPSPVDEDLYNTITTEIIALVESFCASVYPSLTMEEKNQPKPQSMADVSGSRGYKLGWPLATMRQVCPQIVGLEDRYIWISSIFHRIEVDFCGEKE